MTTPRLHERVAPQGTQPKLAKIIVDAAAPPLDCTVVDYSTGGACLELSGRPTLPSRFELQYGANRKDCMLVWIRDRRVGVEF